MNDEGQQTLLGFFAPTAGVHHVPPGARPLAPRSTDDVVFEREWDEKIPRKSV